MKAWVAKVLLPSVLRVLRVLLPTRPVVVVVSGVPTEGNAIEVVRELLARYPGRVVWVGGPSYELCVAQGIDRVEHLGRYSRSGVWAYLTAEAVFLTHGAYGQPRRVPRKPTANVWHGSGMKVMAPGLLPDTRVRGPVADLLVSGARIWGDYYADLCDMAHDEVVYCANPRVDAFARPLTASQLAGLGIDDERFVVWMPTFRSTAGWSDSTDPTSQDRLREQAALVARACSDRGIPLVLKAHPLDADLYDVPGIVPVTDAALEAAGRTVYELLGAAAGLLSDASSVWTDYLLLDRPIGFVFPDHDAYREGRGVQPADIMDWLPGDLLDDRAAIDRWLDDLEAGGAGSAAQRARSAGRIGLAVPVGGASAGMLLDRLAGTGTAFARSLATGPARRSVGPTSHN